MYRYFVLIWNSEDPEATADARLVVSRLRQSPDWLSVVDEPGFLAFHAGAGGLDATSRDQLTSCESRTLSGLRRGVVFGRLFRRGRELEARAPAEPVNATESERIFDTGGKHLLEAYWGRYVALVSEGPGGGRVSVIRDPTGGLPCFFGKYNRVHIVFSEIGGCLALNLLSFSINWKYVSWLVPYSALQVRETGLNEVLELQPGERARFGGAEIETTLIWSPAEIARNPIVDPVQAVAAVRETVKECIHAWASLHRSVVHNLSGGLDSSIVLGCLKSAPSNPRITCVHYFSGNEDERIYARLVAEHMDTELVEVELDPAAAPLRRLSQIRPAPKPWFYVYDLIHSPVEASLMTDRCATASFSGSGGDGLFVQARAELAVADYLQHSGLRPGVFGVALDAARINRASIWPTLYQGISRYWKPPSRSMLSDLGDPRAVIPGEVYERIRNDRNLLHVWLRDADGLPPGLRWQIFCLSNPAQFYESFGGATEIERTLVLMSQPVMEVCLRIPSYVWITGGRDREIARRAFTDVLPQAVIRRTHKGLADRYNRKVLDENVDFLREMLLDGLLAGAGLLDRTKVESFISRNASPAGFEYNEVLRRHLCTEIWLRRWTGITTSSVG